MLKRYCDICGLEIIPADIDRDKSRRVSGSVQRKGVKLDLEITLTLKNQNQIDVCKYCIIESVALLDDRNTSNSSGKPVKV